MPLVTRTSTQGNFFKEESEPTNWLEGDLWSKISTGVLSMNVGGEAVPVSLIPQMVDWLALKAVTTYVPEDDTRTWKILTTPAGLTTGISFEEAGTDYQVAAGKTFTIVLIQVHPSATGRTSTFYQSNAADGITGEVDKFITATTSGGGAYNIPIVNEPTIAAEKFLNWKVSNSTTPPDISIIGFEA